MINKQIENLIDRFTSEGIASFDLSSFDDIKNTIQGNFIGDNAEAGSDPNVPFQMSFDTEQSTVVATLNDTGEKFSFGLNDSSFDLANIGMKAIGANIAAAATTMSREVERDFKFVLEQQQRHNQEHTNKSAPIPAPTNLPSY